MTQGCHGKAAVEEEVERPELASVSPEPPQWHQLVQAPTTREISFKPPKRHQLVKFTQFVKNSLKRQQPVKFVKSLPGIVAKH